MRRSWNESSSLWRSPSKSDINFFNLNFKVKFSRRLIVLKSATKGSTIILSKIQKIRTISVSVRMIRGWKVRKKKDKRKRLRPHPWLPVSGKLPSAYLQRGCSCWTIYTNRYRTSVHLYICTAVRTSRMQRYYSSGILNDFVFEFFVSNRNTYISTSLTRTILFSHLDNAPATIYHRLSLIIEYQLSIVS